MQKKATISVLIIGILFLLTGCSTKKNTFTRRAYHNLTAHYNGYFNGNESMKEGVAALEKAHVDDYTTVLPIYKLGNQKNASAIFPQMDRAYKKASLMIQRHSIFIKGEEYCKWIDDCYLMVAKSQFYKQDYNSAIITFDYIANTYKKSPLKNTAMLWNALANNQLKKFQKSEAILKNISAKSTASSGDKWFRSNYPLVYADFYLKQELYSQAIPYLLEGIKKSRSKKMATRLHFILAQTYQKENNLNKAAEHYEIVVKRNAPYEMTFNASLNLAITYNVRSGSSKNIYKQLEKMLKDPKNSEFKDQIFYVLGELALKEKDTTKAINYYKESATNSLSNDKQKAMSYLKMAELYFIKTKYENSQIYYDSAVNFLPKDFPNYTAIVDKRNVLNELAANLKTIQLQDSLLKLSTLSKAELDNAINQLISIAKKEDELKKQKELEEQQQLALINQQKQNLQDQTSGAGSWYFYNPTAVNFGMAEFKKKWGSRKLEDLWRLRNKEVMDDFAIQNNTNNTSDTSSSKGKSKTPDKYTKDFYLKDIPFTDSLKNISHKKIQESIFAVGSIYKENLNENKRAASYFELLLTRYKETDLLLRTYYQLYRTYTNLNDLAKADYYKNLILKNYPESDYAKIILNPDYYKIIEQNRNIVNNFYASTYSFFNNKEYFKTIDYCIKSDSLYPNNELRPKFALLKAHSFAYSGKMQDYETELNNIIKTHPKSDEKPLAENMLAVLSKYKASNNGTLPDINKPDNDSASLANKYPYKYDSTSLYFYVMVIDMMNADINELKIRYSDYNNKYFGLSKLTISAFFLDDYRQMITVSKFQNLESALIYYNAVKEDKEIFDKYHPRDIQQFVISTDNYPILYKNKKVEQYLKYFNNELIK